MIDQIFIFYDQKEGYDNYINIAAKHWEYIFPTAKITVFYLGDKPTVSDSITLEKLPDIPSVPSSFAINVYKFLYPTTLQTDDIILATTQKTIPINIKYFKEKFKVIDNNKITSLLTNLEENKQPFNYWVGRPSIWKKLFNIRDINAFALNVYKNKISYDCLYREINNDYLICINDLFMNNVKQMMRLTNKEFNTFNEMYGSLTATRRDEIFKKSIEIALRDNHYIDYIISSNYTKYKDYIDYICNIIAKSQSFVNGSAGLKIVNDNSPLMII